MEGFGKVTLPFVGMIMAEVAQVGLIILSKQVMSQGMNNFIFIFYSNTLAALILLPSSYFIHRFHRPPITFQTLSGFFLLGLLGYLAQAFGYAGINYSSATLSTSLLNLVPGFTFILAVLFRMEQLDWRRSSSLAKALGTIVSIVGAFIVTLYKGPALLKGLQLLSPANSSQEPVFAQESNWILGGLFLAADCVMASAYIIVQASILKKYPAELIVVFFYCFFVAIQSGLTCLVVERDIGAWSLEPKFRLLVVLYSGVVGSAFQVGVITWCLHQTGPVFVSIFKPIGIAVSVVVGVAFLGDTFYLGSLLGATVIVVGFYSVLWGKAKEIEDGSMRSLDSNNKTPLLKGNSSEEI
ncbi:PREDICTED: WAT1-related protein At3g28050-like [Lupinus angustifolius]|nr:PREDICTED: WAT1-related protein At3g28050-like [Lupinus angustifolius]XP_019415846.1 PREDICTED: WAT1-related protein At3g28050-like [Lupinus angustifolius]